MTEAVDDTFQSLFDATIRQHGGLSALSAVNLEVVSVICRLLLAVRGADARDVPKTAALVASLTATLPAPIEPDEQKVDLSLLSDAQLETLEVLARTCRGEVDPEPTPVVPSPPEIGESERVGRDLGAWIDQRAAGRLTEPERLHLRNEFQAMARGRFIVHALWEPLYRASMESEITRTVEQAVRAALTAIGRDDVKVLPPERKQLASPSEPLREFNGNNAGNPALGGGYCSR